MRLGVMLPLTDIGGEPGVVRDFARYLSAFEPRTEVPADGLLPHRYRRVAISATP